MKDDVSHKSRSVSAASSSGESVVLHTPPDEPVMQNAAREEIYGRPHDSSQLLDHASHLKAPELAEIGYNVEYLAATNGGQAIRPTGRRMVSGSDYLRKPLSNSRVIRFKRATRKFWA